VGSGDGGSLDGADAAIEVSGASSAASTISAISAAATWSMRGPVATTRPAVGGWLPAENRTCAPSGFFRSSHTRARTPG
jgi:hypothetical protein